MQMQCLGIYDIGVALDLDGFDAVQSAIVHIIEGVDYW